MQLPLIHLNGTSKAELLQQQLDMLAALRKAADVMAKCAPHGRDYYPINSNAASIAFEEHNARRTALSDIIVEIECIAHAIDEQG